MDSHSPEVHSKTHRFPSFDYADSDSSSTRLLEKGTSDNGSIEIKSSYGDKRAQKQCPTWLTVHLCALLVYTVIFLSALTKMHLLYAKASKGSQKPLDMIYSPMRDAIRYEARTQHNSEKNNNSIYQGPPTLETKEAWMSLFEYGDLLISKEELEKLDRTSIQLADGSGRYIATPDTYHQLHCLWRLYEWVNAEAYDVVLNEIHFQHIIHCIDLLRSFVQCHATASIMTYQWADSGSGIPVGYYEVDDVCVDWGYYQSWVTERALDDLESASKLFIHPELGPVSRKGEP